MFALSTSLHANPFLQLLMMHCLIKSYGYDNLSDDFHLDPEAAYHCVEVLVLPLMEQLQAVTLNQS